MMTVVTNYKTDDVLRRSFDALAQETFGISFEAWYQKGYWDENYRTYSFCEDGKIVSNASANWMTLLIDGKEVHAIQIGTVMTHPDYRRRGLAYLLIQKIFEDFDAQVDFYFLAADLEAMPLYAKCGFSEVPSVECVIKKTDSMVGNHMEPQRNLIKPKQKPIPMQIGLETLIEWKQKSPLKGSQLEVIKDAHILAFYWFHGFDQKVYQIDGETLVVADFDKTEKKMVLYDFYQKGTKSMSQIITEIGLYFDDAIDEIVVAFDVRGLSLAVKSNKVEVSGWMIRAHKGLELPNEFCYPKLAQA